MSYSLVDPYQTVLPRLNLEEALKQLTPNDLLPPRPEEKARGQLGARFLEALYDQIERGTYDPQPAHFVPSPRSEFATRPAALVRLVDRVVFAALVSTLESRITDHLLGPDLIFWPRGTTGSPPWAEFQLSPIHSGQPYILRSDIAAFYESVDHERLTAKIIDATGRRDVARALSSFLSRVMGDKRGLPQGLLHSDSLATLYLADLDFSMVRKGYEYYRLGDDIRVACSTFGEGARAISDLEATVRQLGLLLNIEKTLVLKRETYEGHQTKVDDAITATKSRVLSRKVDAIGEDADALLTAIQESGLPDSDDLIWRVFYHNNIEFDELVRKLGPTLEPSDTEAAATLLTETVEKRPGQIPGLERSEFRRRLGQSLALLTAGRSPEGLEHVGTIFAGFPEELRKICSYLLAVVRKQPKTVIRQAERALHDDEYLTEWKLAWLVGVLLSAPEKVSKKTVRLLSRIVEDPDGKWLGVTGIIQLLAARGDLDRHTLLRSASVCPAVLQVDLVVAATRIQEPEVWARAFLTAAKEDRVHSIVASMSWS